jgi:hypothetical protein
VIIIMLFIKYVLLTSMRRTNLKGIVWEKDTNFIRPCCGINLVVVMTL